MQRIRIKRTVSVNESDVFEIGLIYPVTNNLAHYLIERGYAEIAGKEVVAPPKDKMIRKRKSKMKQ